jgi:hypothetical protein
LVSGLIAGTGSVAKTVVPESSLDNTAVERCVQAKVKGWRSLPSAGGGMVEDI